MGIEREDVESCLHLLKEMIRDYVHYGKSASLSFQIISSLLLWQSVLRINE